MMWFRALTAFFALSALLAPVAAADRPLVVLDPGHGGSNTGAASLAPGVHEKDVTLELARAVAARLRRRGVDVFLTRERDVYLTLRQRTKMANELGADLFVSLHTNATEAHSQRGFETYILTPEALDVDARALRLSDGGPRLGVDRATALLLDDVERGSAHRQAAHLAAAIQRELASVWGEKEDRGVRQGSLDVLFGATMPAVLVEVGFLDHPIEGHELLEPEVQDRLAAALAEALAPRRGKR